MAYACLIHGRDSDQRDELDELLHQPVSLAEVEAERAFLRDMGVGG